MTGAERAARRTAAAAVLGDFRAAFQAAPLTSPPPMAEWAMRLASALGDLLAGLSRGELPALAPHQRDVLAQALADAVTYRQPGPWCTDCRVHAAELCEDHAADLDKADSYLTLARSIGTEVPS